MLFIWRFLLVENTTYGCRQTEEFEFFVRGGAAVAVARCGCLWCLAIALKGR